MISHKLTWTITTLFVLASVPAMGQESRFRTLLDRIEPVTEEALDIPAAAAPAFVRQDCEVSDERREQLDALLSMNAADMASSEKIHAKWGVPVATVGTSHERLLHHKEYIINYNGNLKLPTFASYQLQKIYIVKRSRIDCFRKDIRLNDIESATLDDYEEPVFDRGHLVPRADMNRSEEAMINTFVLSNMMPQHDNFNRGVWQTFEATIRAWAVDKESLHIITGSIFDKEPPLGRRDDDDNADRVKPLKNVAIPTHFYKIALYERPSGFIEAIAILLPHTDNEFPYDKERWEKLLWLEEHITSIDQIEEASGYDFFPDMPEDQERAVERSIASGLWQ